MKSIIFPAQKNEHVLYLAIDVFLKGGIQRYSRAQIQALRELLGAENVTTLVLHPPPQESRFRYEDAFEVEYVEKGRNTFSRLRFILRSVAECWRIKPSVIWTDHVKIFPLAVFLHVLCRAQAVIGNVYGLEVWSGLNFFQKFSTRRLTHIVSDSHFTAKYISETFSIPLKKISVIWDPVDIVRFTPNDTTSTILSRYGVPYRPETIYLMTLGRVSVGSRHKGFDRMLDTMKMLKRDDIVYLIVGDGDDRARLEERVKDEGLERQVYFLGAVPETDLVSIYNTADIFILVSERGAGLGEGVPLTPLEAAACGVPIIVGNEDGSQEAVDDGINGFVVSPKDINVLRSAILKLVDDPQLRAKMGRAARQKVETSFSYASFRSLTGNVFNQVYPLKKKA